MRLFHHYSDLLSLLQCQSATHVTIVVQLHTNNVKENNLKQKFNQKFGAEKPSQIIVKTASDAEIRRSRGKTEALHMHNVIVYFVKIKISFLPSFLSKT